MFFNFIKLFILVFLLYFNSLTWAGCPGCCSGHKGISSSCAANGKVICNDGTTSPSCGCSQCGVTPPHPICTAKKETKNISCPNGEIGSIQQERNYTCAFNGLWSEWATIKNTCSLQNMSGRVISVADGDTLTIQNMGKSYIVRLAEIDAPEKCQPYGDISRASLVDLALHKNAVVSIVDTDKYNRTVGKVTIDGSTETVNLVQLQRGLAWVYDMYAQDYRLDGVERIARENKKGLWVDANPIPPWDWRHTDSGCTRDPDDGNQVTDNQKIIDYQNVAEFYNSKNKHYFMTSSVEEANAIEAGSAGPDWKRTGNNFKVWPKNSGEKGTSLVCRFYNPGASSHFFTANEAECQALRSLENEQRAQAMENNRLFMGWVFEGDDYRVKLPASDSSCPSGTEKIYRAYNNRHEYNDQNHRFSPWPNDLVELQKNNWILEGVAMCAPK